jgi:hypothetical protein
MGAALQLNFLIKEAVPMERLLRPCSGDILFKPAGIPG